MGVSWHHSPLEDLPLLVNMANLHQNFLGSQNNIFKIYIFNNIVTNSIKMNT